MSPSLQLGPVRVEGDWSPPTPLVLLIGHPVEHSWSPAMQNAAFRAAAFDAAYAVCDVPPDALAAVFAALRYAAAAGEVLGANVTVPHKRAVLPYLDGLDARAALAGAVNTIQVAPPAGAGVLLQGANTDTDGLVAALDEIGARLAGSRVLVLGSGGMARAAVAAALVEGALEIRVAARDPLGAQDLLDDLLSRWQGRAPLVACMAFDAAAAVLAGTDLLVQATSLGRQDGEMPLSLDAAGSRLAVLDAVYAAGGTPLVRAARARGLRAADGRALLVHQGAAAFALWTGRTAPVDVMRAALEA